ncbi:hypothetical protein [Acinetobacter venetianus]|uniref:hypothetical protein n=1 Tax=Acinetobacter venetianus TaxID=52133 RepID=UPI003A94BCFE
MAFRADESIKDGKEWAENYLLAKLTTLSEQERSESRDALLDYFIDLGPIVDSYPTWHPLINHTGNPDSVTTPNMDTGYEGLDHTVYFAHGFITCPYHDGQRVIDSVDRLEFNPSAHITAEKLNVKFYHPDANPILVKCNWYKPLANDGTIPLSTAIPLLLENELPHWRHAEVAETWESMRSHFLGSPCGKRSSLFVNQETGQAMKKIWEALINTGMYGPIMMR